MSTSVGKSFCKSVLRVEIPVVVTLAHKKMRIDQVLQLVPGVMIQFDKPCDSPMTVEIADQAIATGDIVKTGDKFGIRLGNIMEPSERFVSLAEYATGSGSRSPNTSASTSADDSGEYRQQNEGRRASDD